MLGKCFLISSIIEREGAGGGGAPTLADSLAVVETEYDVHARLQSWHQLSTPRPCPFSVI